MPDARHAAFAAVVDGRTRVVILGSLPGGMSLAQGQYYAQPSNQFWKLTGAVVGRDLVSLPYPGRLEALLDAGIGLWDTIESAHRKGSLDSAIRNVEPRDLRAFAASLPNLQAIAFNGAKAAALGRKQLADRASKAALIDLPSSSAAYCTISFGAKLERWLPLQAFLSPDRGT